ncbi:signal recognition particle subunit SRP68 [Babesia bovis T2Bo]|uniref:Signal recognition particle subunit SRP68 n=1 Tax=Babesia bovis TaxID=5865 RepID=A7APM2_BABBO|nr:signal recognition particle subunit SRP68 [Babesia bovis T2Bo]EDO08506.1 signal recognition particle subunit SRP68 [Babesia bovis T2Bo]|eukprot:XP_001612074.1 hypothetical protein [Babesia bovis T2Bo]
MDSVDVNGDTGMSSSDHGGSSEVDDLGSSVTLNFTVLDYINEIRFKHGMRIEEYSRYHGYCSKRLCNLRRQLRMGPIRSNKYVRLEFPETVSDVRYLEILALCAERSWAYGMVLKSQCEASHTPRPNLRHRSLKRFDKALTMSTLLEAACQSFAEANSVNNARVYRSFMEGVVHFERKRYTEAFASLSLYANVMDQRHRNKQDRITAEGYSSQLNQVNAMIKMCSFHIRSAGVKFGGKPVLHQEDDDAELLSVVSDPDGNLNLYCRGALMEIQSPFLFEQIHDVISAFDKLVITDTVLSNLNASTNLDNDIHSELVVKFPSDALLASYEEISTLVSECVDTVHSEMMSSMESQDLLRRIEGVLHIIKTLLEMEKCILMGIIALHAVYRQNKSSSGCRYLPDCGEPLRFAHILKQHLGTLMNESNLQSTFHIALEATRSVNGMLMGIYKLYTGEYADGMSLLKWSMTRLERGIKQVDHSNTRLVNRCMLLFQIFHRTGLLCIRKYYKRCVAIYMRHKLGENPDIVDTMGVDKVFDLTKRMLPCKPILFDLAHIHNNPPTIGSKSGIIGGVKNIIRSFWK